MMNNPDILIEFYKIFAYIIIFIGFFQSGVLRNVMFDSRFLVFLIIIVCITAFGLAPEDAAAAVDRENYQIYYLSVNNVLYTSSITEKGFFYFCKICRFLLGRKATLFFLLCATIYIGSYNRAIKQLSTNGFYTWLFCLLSIGFLAYSVNTMREGLAIAVFLLGVCSFFKNNRFYFIAYSLIAVSIHVSLLLPVLCFFITTQRINIRFCYAVWIGAFLLSLLGLSSYITQFSEILQIDKLSGYLNNLDSERYKTGFRWGFVIYSLFPMVLGGLLIYRYKYSNEVYLKIYKTYILVNAIWLLFIQIPFTDRIAYLSWFMIPFVITIPLVDKESGIKSKHLFLAVSIVVLLLARFVSG